MNLNTRTLKHILKTVADYFQIDENSITSKSRRQEIVQARQLAMYFAKRLTNLTLERIGEHIGGKDHATVAYACRIVSDMIETDRNFKTIVSELEEKFEI